ncbi:uncharacterized protein LOC106868220 [Octopus bimaculoides]|uniref:uncharacterized protein LOC106868220 n=1 Tax=Octopus bimaculoides TaxID=37653 RepID=UPI00071DB4FC|nr:uncharacterized protein LOC106868220 [Octopus bimaculoides]|eukprot:XP_014768871.1 PREDICTED: uncharacterized protein LOC106868220 [Octopus bimaculoides]
MNRYERAIYQQNQRRRYRESVQNMNAGEIDNLRRHQMQRQRVRRHTSVQNRVIAHEFEQFDIRELNIMCEHCGALRFRNENNSCCHNGKVNVPALQPYPEILKILFEGNDQESVSVRRNYNCTFSFGSFGVKLAASPGRGPYCFRIRGQTYHTTTNLHPANDQPQYGQLYIIDADEALQ